MGNCFGDSSSNSSSGGGGEMKGSNNDWNGEETGNEIKIILLGSGESGKSTMYRQIQKILAQMKRVGN